MKQPHVLVTTLALLTASLGPAAADEPVAPPAEEPAAPPPPDPPTAPPPADPPPAPPDESPDAPPSGEQPTEPPTAAPVPEAAPPAPEPEPPAPPPPPPPPPPPAAPSPDEPHAVAFVPTPPPSPAVPPAPPDDKPPPLSIHVFADGQYVWSTRRNNAVDAAGQPLPHPAHRAWERNNGFALSFLGLDTVYDTETFAVTASLRFGSSVDPYYGASTASTDLDGVASAFQAYGTWKASPALAIDVGRFSTIYGAEVAESWKNLNYTRGALYYAYQPFWHTGVRAAYQATSELKLTAMVVDGVNNSLDAGTERPSIGVQAAYTTPTASVLVGYLGSGDSASDAFDQFFDLVATWNVGRLALVFNADLFANRLPATSPALFASTPGAPATNRYTGASLAAGYQVSDKLRIAARGEVLVDHAADTRVHTGTATLDYRPLGNSNVVLRLDNRFEDSDQPIFIDRDAAPTRHFFQAVVGFVVTSN